MLTPDEIRKVREALVAIAEYPREGHRRRTKDGYPAELAYDEYAYKRMVDTYRDTAREALSLLDAALNQEGGEADTSRSDDPRRHNTTPRQAEPSVGADYAELVKRLHQLRDELVALGFYGADPKLAADAIETLVRERDGWRRECGEAAGEMLAAKRQAASAERERDELRSALEEIDAWSRAYPLAVFPEPDFAKARVLLEAGGMTLDAISASNMRHVVTGVGEIARSALSSGKRQEPST